MNEGGYDSGQQGRFGRERNQDPKFEAFQRKATPITKALFDASQLCNREREKASDPTAAIYGRTPFAFPYFEASKEAGIYGDKYRTEVGTDPELADWFYKFNLYPKQFNGLSLRDIETMEKDPETGFLIPNDRERFHNLMSYKKGHRLFQRFVKPELSASHREVLSGITEAAVQSITHKYTRSKTSSDVSTLLENIRAGYDYYVDTIVNPDESPEDALAFLRTLIDSPYLINGIATYIPARLGITPSGTETLLNKKAEDAAGRSRKMLWKGFYDNAMPIVYSAAPWHKIDPEYHESIKPNAMRREAFAQQLAQMYPSHNDLGQEQQVYSDEEDRMENFLTHNFESMVRRAAKTPQGITFQGKTDQIKGIRVLSVYPRTAIVLPEFREGYSMPIEITSTGEVYGIPASVLKNHPAASDAFRLDLLNNLIPEQQPVQFQISKPAVRQPDTFQELPKPQIMEEQFHIEDDLAIHIKQPKRKRLRQLSDLDRPEATVVRVESQEPNERKVFFSREQIAEKLGVYARQGELVDDALETLLRFQQGAQIGKIVKESNGKEISIRSGDFRIILNREGNNTYSIKEIPNRRDAYGRK